MALTDPFHQIPILPDAKQLILQHLLQPKPNQRKPRLDEHNGDAYFDYYSDQCRQALHNRGKHISARTHMDLVDIVHLLVGSSSRDDIRTTLCPKINPATCDDIARERLDGSIDLTTRLIVMMDIGVLDLGHTGRDQLPWTGGSLKDYVRGFYDRPIKLGQVNVKLEKIFTARNLSQIAGIEVEWTENLADHLRLIGDDDKKVAIFHYASFLDSNQW
jgi:hypothetical protein